MGFVRIPHCDKYFYSAIVYVVILGEGEGKKVNKSDLRFGEDLHQET